MPDLFDVLVDGVAAVDEQVDAAGEEAARVSARKVAKSDDVVEAILTEAARITARRLRATAQTAGLRAKREAEQITRQDPLKVRAITSIDVATKRQERAKEREATNGQGR